MKIPKGTHTHLPSLLFVNLNDEHKRLKKIKLLSEKLHAETLSFHRFDQANMVCV